MMIFMSELGIEVAQVHRTRSAKLCNNIEIVKGKMKKAGNNPDLLVDREKLLLMHKMK